MSLLALALVTMTVLAVGYLTYGRFIARQFRLDDRTTTPAVARADGIDFVPTRPFYLLGQHFSAIAAAGPIVGPIVACQDFGWLPCVLWILLGVVFIGAVHDFSALVASVRHGAHSIAEIARANISKKAWAALVAFIWLALLYVIVAFTDVTVATFTNNDEELARLAGVEFNKGGAVAAASVMYLLLATVMGVVQRFFRWPMWLLTAVFVPATLGVVWLGTKMSTLLLLDAKAWYWIVLGYCLAASMFPLWLLQQSRGYLGGFVLYLAIGIGLVGLLFGGYRVEQPMIAAGVGFDGLLHFFAGGEDVPKMTTILFPFLFVTIACGACSGFHGLVCGGTTSKQIEKESHCKPVAFGAMLLEGFVAIIALSTVMIMSAEQTKGVPPGSIYGDGIARFLTLILGENALLFAKTFGAMAVATFVFDTLDVATRLGRYLLQELFEVKGRVGGAVASLATVGVPLGILLTSAPGSYRAYWTLFGSSNQLLAALTLLGITVWLKRNGKRCWYTAVPMVFVMAITVTALVVQVVHGFRAAIGGTGDFTPVINGVVAVILLALAVFFVSQAVKSIRATPRHQPEVP
ncbi:MAG: carbon starvation protein A [Phycisphaeraceae bacterium]|nr:carbon starvation protein A [Phycisphaeraceae bacterium]